MSDSVESTLSILQTCFSVCVAFCILFFIITVVLFFLFDIRTIFNIRTGRAKRKTVSEMQAANSQTGRLRVEGKTLTSKLDKQRRSKKLKITPPNNSPVQMQSGNGGSQNTAPVDYSNGGSASPKYDVGAAPTSLLNNYDYDASPTGRLDQNEQVAEKPQSMPAVAAQPLASFRVCKKIVVVHTNEIIS